MPQIVAVMVGGILTLAGIFAAKIWDEWRQTKALKGALRAEIEAHLRIVSLKRHEELAELILSLWNNGEDKPLIVFGSERVAKDHVFESNAGKLGSLGPALAADVASFYVQLTAIRIVLQGFEDGTLNKFPLKDRITQLEGALTLWKETKVLGQKLVSSL